MTDADGVFADVVVVEADRGAGAQRQQDRRDATIHNGSTTDHPLHATYAPRNGG